jgi:hypothetical protein
MAVMARRWLALILTSMLVCVRCNLHAVLVTVRNFAGHPVRIFWVSGDSLVSQTPQPIQNASHTVINSFNGHAFAIAPDDVEPEPRRADFTVGDDDLYIILNEDYSLTSRSVIDTVKAR